MIAYIAQSREVARRIFGFILPDHTIDHNDKVWTPARVGPIGLIVWNQDRLRGLELCGFVDLDGSLARDPDLRNVLFSRLIRTDFSFHMRAHMDHPIPFFVAHATEKPSHSD